MLYLWVFYVSNVSFPKHIAKQNNATGDYNEEMPYSTDIKILKKVSLITLFLRTVKPGVNFVIRPGQ